MRLLKWTVRGELTLTADLNDKEIPPYAVLSHTWGTDEEEVSFIDLQHEPNHYQNKVGYEKLRFCGKQAVSDGIDHFWVDTCCIKKTNPSELSEAITSMYRWYANAVKCYVYLSDVSAERRSTLGDEQPVWMPELRSSRWFTRSWTLQELLAPSVVEFFSKEGNYIGSRKTLLHELRGITNISLAALDGAPLARFPPYTRWRWAHGRQAKRVEDEAYCLMGICDVSIPIMYGEGKDALRRLEEAIEERMGQGTSAAVHQGANVQPLPRYQFKSPRPQISLSRRAVRGVPQSFMAKDITEFCDTSDTSNSDTPLGPMFNDHLDWDACLDSLAFDQSHDQGGAIGDNTPGTCEWLLESSEYTKWIQENGLFLVQGHPGCGKSTLIKYALTQQPSRDSGVLNIFFFFQSSGVDLQSSAQGMLRSFLYQLLDEDEDLRPEFCETWRKMFGARTPSRNFVWNQRDLTLIFRRLVNTCAARYTVRIFVDAVDECKTQDREDVVGLFHSLRAPYQGTAAATKIGTFMTTRKHPHTLSIADFKVQLEDRNQHDIRQYIEKELRLDDSAGSIRGELKTLLQDQADGSFLWLVWAIRSVHELNKKGETLNTIKRDMQKRPKKLDELYEGLLEEITESQIVEAGMLFQWVCFAARPLSPAELRTALIVHTTGKMTSMGPYLDEANARYAADEQQIWKKINNLSRGLVDFSRTASADGTTVQFYHVTVKEFMLSRGLQIIGRKAGSADRLVNIAHAQLASTCLWFMSCNEVVTAMLERDLEYLTEHTFFQYAGDHWFFHAAKAEKPGVVADVDWPSPATLTAWIHLGQKTDKVTSSCFAAGSQPLHVAAQHGLTSLLYELIRSIDDASVLKPRGEPSKRLQALTSPSGFESSSRASLRKAESPLVRRSAAMKASHEKSDSSSPKHTPRRALRAADRRAGENDPKVGMQPVGIKTSLHELKNKVSLGKREERTNVLNFRDINGNTPLHLAAAGGQLDAVALLQREGADVRSLDKENSTPLHAASRNGHFEVVEYLSKHGAAADICTPAKDGWTPLCAASGNGHLKVVDFLLEHGAGDVIHVAGKVGRTPLYAASRGGHVEIVKRLLTQRASTDIHTSNKHGWTPLCVACDGGHLEVVKLLFEQGAATDIHERTHSGRTPLCVASGDGNPELVKFLLKHGAATDIHIATKDGRTPLHAASKHGHLKVVKLLFEYGAGTDICSFGEGGFTPLGAASGSGHLEVVKFLLDHGAGNKCMPAKDGWTPLYAASTNGHLKVMKLLLEHGAAVTDIHTTTEDGWTPLPAALSYGHLEVAKFLLDHGAAIADIHKPIQGGWTALCIASSYGQFEAAKFLIEHDADVHASAKDGRTPLHVACRCGSLEVVQLLLGAGADVNARGACGQSPLICAIAHACKAICRFLIQSSADATLVDGFGRTAVDWLKLLETDNELLKSLCSDPNSPPQISIQGLDTSIASLSTEIINQQAEDCAGLIDYLGRLLLTRDDTTNANIAFQHSINTTIQRSRTQYDIQCDLCNKYPIQGGRFVCKTCPDIDLCPSCIDKYRKGKHFAACHMHEYFEVTESALMPMDRASFRVWLQDRVIQYTNPITT